MELILELRRTFLYIVVLSLLFSCREVQDVEFVKVQKVEFYEIRNGNIIAKAHAIFNNPNNRGGKVKKVDISVFVEDRESGKVLRDESFKVYPNAEFIIPLDLEITFEEVAKNLFSGLLAKDRKKSLPLHLKGNVWVTVYGLTRKVPVDYQTTLRYTL